MNSDMAVYPKERCGMSATIGRGVLLGICEDGFVPQDKWSTTGRGQR